MIPSSIGSSNFNQPPLRKSAIREKKVSEINEASSSTFSDTYLNKKQKNLLGKWCLKADYWSFVLKNKNTPQSRAILKAKVEAFLPLLKNFITCIMNEAKSSVLSSVDLMIETSILIKGQDFPIQLLHLFTSNYAKELIRTRQDSNKISSKPHTIECIPSLLQALISAILEMNSYLNLCIDLDGLKKLNLSEKVMSRSFSKALSNIFLLKSIKNIELREITNIILNNANFQNNAINISSMLSIVKEAMANVQCAMQLFAGQVCSKFIAYKITPPLNGKELFCFVEKILKNEILPIKSIMHLKIWENCIFCALAKMFLKTKMSPENPLPDNLFTHLLEDFSSIIKKHNSISGKKSRLALAIALRLIHGKKDVYIKNKAALFPKITISFSAQSLSLFKISFNNLLKSFMSLKSLLSILCKMGEKIYQKIEPKNTHPYIKLEILTYLKKSEMKDVLTAAFPEYYLIEHINSKKPTTERSIGSLEVDNSVVPTRTSTVRSSIKRTHDLEEPTQIGFTIASSTTKSEKEVCSTDINPKRMKESTSKQITTISQLSELTDPVFAAILNSSSFLHKIDETAMLIENVIESAFYIVILSYQDHAHLSPLEIVETAMALTVLLQHEECNENDLSEIAEKISMDLICCQKKIPKELLKTGIAFGALAFVKFAHFMNTSIKKEKCYQLYKLSKNLNKFVSLLSMRFKELLSTLKAQAELGISIEGASTRNYKLTIFLYHTSTLLRKYKTNELRRIVLLNAVIQSLLENSDEE